MLKIVVKCNIKIFNHFKIDKKICIFKCLFVLKDILM